MMAGLTTRLPAALLLSLSGLATATPAEPKVVPLWPGAAPGSESWTQKEI